MSGREEGYYGPSSSDLGCGALFVIVALVLGVLLVVVLCLTSLGDTWSSEVAETNAGVQARTDLAIDVTDQWAMHDARLPTKADVLAWRMCGRWGFCKVANGMQEVHIWRDLPGEALIRDALYG